jgi:integrase
MAAEKITKSAIDALKPAAADAYLWDTELKGFGVKVTPAGRKVYLVQFRLGGRKGKTQRVTLGVHGDITPDQARKLAQKHLGQIADGKDPAQERRETKRKLETALTFKEVCGLYLEKNGKDNRSWAETKRLLEYDAIKRWGSRLMASITAEDVMVLIEDVEGRAPVTAKALFSALRPLFGWAKPRKYILINPMEDLKSPAPPKSRDRVLSDDEIVAFWKATEKLGWPFGPIFRLMLLTAQRENEVGGMEWTEIDRAISRWLIPKARTKNGKEHVVDISQQACSIISKLPRKPCEFGKTFVFTTTGKTSVSGWSKAKRKLDALMFEILGVEQWKRFQEAGGDDKAACKLGFPDADAFKNSLLPPWRLHDLRRTAATRMAGQKVPPHIVERILNHISGEQGGLVGVYQHHEYRGERREAIEALGAHIERLINGHPAENVVELATRR